VKELVTLLYCLKHLIEALLEMISVHPASQAEPLPGRLRGFNLHQAGLGDANNQTKTIGTIKLAQLLIYRLGIGSKLKSP
jgi:hypothetical protein